MLQISEIFVTLRRCIHIHFVTTKSVYFLRTKEIEMMTFEKIPKQCIHAQKFVKHYEKLSNQTNLSLSTFYVAEHAMII